MKLFKGAAPEGWFKVDPSNVDTLEELGVPLRMYPTPMKRGSWQRAQHRIWAPGWALNLMRDWPAWQTEFNNLSLKALIKRVTLTGNEELAVAAVSVATLHGTDAVLDMLRAEE